MALKGGRLALFVVLVLVGLYFTVWHFPPLPFNHQDVGLGKFHAGHAIFGIVLLAAAGYLWTRKK